MSQPKTIYLKEYTPSDFTIDALDLHFDLFEEHTVVTNTMQMVKANPTATTLSLNSVNLELIHLMVDGVVLGEGAYDYADNILSFSDLPDRFTLEIRNRIYPEQNTELEGLYKSGGIFCTQNEPEGFRSITPYLDRPDVMTVYTTTVVADKDRYPVLLANGNPQLALFEELEGGRHSTTWHDPHPKPAHLFALVAGDLGSISDSFVTMSGREIELNIYCDKGNESKCYHAMKSLKEAMVWDEEKYGREYDLDIFNIVAVNSFNFGAMENKGLNIFNAQALLADADTATDGNFMNIQSIVAHEYFHNWTGNRVGCKNWFQLTLKEGLTVFRDQCFSADLNSEAVARIQEVQMLRASQFVEDASPTAHPIQPKSYISMNNFYTSTVYNKGAEVIRMIHTLIGEEAYRKATDLYFESFDGQAVGTEEFLWAMEEASGHDLGQFRRWYHQSGTPTLELVDRFEEGVYTIDFKQIIPNTVAGDKQEPYYFPLRIGLINQAGEEILESLLVLSTAEESFSFEGLESKPYLSLNRDFSAPVIIKQEGEDYAFGMKHDRNAFARYDATQAFGIATLEGMMRGEAMDEAFVEAYGYLLDLEMDLASKALLLQLPSSNTLMQRQEMIDFEPILEAKKELAMALAKRYKAKLLSLYHANHFPNKRATDGRSMAERSIKNSVLNLLSRLDTAEIIALAQEQYDASCSMSDRMVALSIIEDSDKHHNIMASTHFYNKYRDNPMVITKYFALITYSHREGLLVRVEALESDESYDKLIPNHVRAVLGTFTANNKYFHAKDGSGYQFLAGKLLEIDRLNAQTSSRLAGAFKLYEKMNPSNQAQMKYQLEQILATEGISENLYEIVSKILKI